jgi:hypothetical protein
MNYSAIVAIANALGKTGNQIGPPPADLKRLADSLKNPVSARL